MKKLRVSKGNILPRSFTNTQYNRTLLLTTPKNGHISGARVRIIVLKEKFFKITEINSSSDKVL